MAPPTVQQMKLMLNAIPGGAQAAQIVNEADSTNLLVVTGWQQSADGSTFFTPIGTLDMEGHQYVPLG